MTQDNNAPKTMDELKSEYDQCCRLLGEKEYLRWANEQEGLSIKARMYDLNRQAAELNASKPTESVDG